jgi:pilus assembly protein CpaC
LAEPVLTTLSGQEATFISGGEFPVPVPSDEDTIKIEFKEFGVTMKFIPVVLDSGRINLNMHVGVSELSEDAAVFVDIGSASTGFSIPSLTKREASSTLELADGQTMSIAGLISERCVPMLTNSRA